MRTHLSQTMIALYGEEETRQIYDRLEKIDPWFNWHVQTVVYDYVCALKPLFLKEKSLITVTTLITLGKEEQLYYHLKGFLHLGGAIVDLIKVITYLTDHQFIPSSVKALASPEKVVAEKRMSVDSKLTTNSKLAPRNKSLINLSIHIILGKKDKTTQCI